MDGSASDHRSIWFLNTHVIIRVSARDGSDGISVLEHRARQGDSPPLHIHHDEDEIFHVLEGEVRYRVGDRERRVRGARARRQRNGPGPVPPDKCHGFS
ncbi:cupin domain-containing protein [Microvirga aerophila]|uniref:cupin domain-containing protein n=1 Tax=Microvirga aerophila TaxID=670291 RepID=UPI0011BEC7AF